MYNKQITNILIIDTRTTIDNISTKIIVYFMEEIVLSLRENIFYFFSLKIVFFSVHK